MHGPVRGSASIEWHAAPSDSPDHTGSCKGRGRYDPLYHGQYQVTDHTGRLGVIVARCPCCEMLVRCLACQRAIARMIDVFHEHDKDKDSDSDKDKDKSKDPAAKRQRTEASFED